MIAVGALAAHIAHAIDVERIDLDVPLALQGLDSVSAQDVIDALLQQHGLRLPHARLLSASATVRSLVRECMPASAASDGPTPQLASAFIISAHPAANAGSRAGYWQ